MQHKTFSFLKGIIEGRTVQMCEAGRFSEPEIQSKTYCTKILKCLEKIRDLREIHLEKFSRRKWKYFIIDESDIQKPYARKLRGIEKVRDGSIGDPYGKGYPLIVVIGVTSDGEYIPLILQRYEEIQKARLQCVEKILEIFGPDTSAIWILDRGFDDKKFINRLLDEKQQFIIRMDRRGGERSLQVGEGEKETWKISVLTAHMGRIGYRRVYMPGRTEELTLIHYRRGQQKEPLAVLTSLSPATTGQAKKCAKIYLHRWKIEDYLLFIKQKFLLENMMVQKPAHVDGLLTMVLMASHFVMKETFEMERGELSTSFSWWKRKENATLCWSAVARFYQFLFEYWTLVDHNLRTSHSPPNPLQLKLIPF